MLLTERPGRPTPQHRINLSRKQKPQEAEHMDDATLKAEATDTYWGREIVGGWDHGDGVEIIATEFGVRVAVTQEHAVGSYNETFTCSFDVPRADIPDLIAWLEKQR
jgi:hypothetical protein